MSCQTVQFQLILIILVFWQIYIRMSSLIHINDEFEQHVSVKTVIAGFLHYEFLNDTLENTYPSFLI